MLRTLAALSVFAGTLVAQERVASENLHTRVLCVVPMIGTGTIDDPRRPMFVPKPPSLFKPPDTAKAAETGEPTPPSGILAFQYQLSDDGNYALLELVGSDRKALDEVFNSTDARVKVFDRKLAQKETIETEFKKHKKDFNLDKYVPARVQ